MNSTLQEQLRLWCARHGVEAPSKNVEAPSKNVEAPSKKYYGLEECFKNVIRTANSKKLSYCYRR